MLVDMSKKEKRGDGRAPVFVAENSRRRGERAEGTGGGGRRKRRENR